MQSKVKLASLDCLNVVKMGKIALSILIRNHYDKRSSRPSVV
jgi:TRAP-type mannitol/chloroaromatic compound transport system permease large subunit